MPFKTQTIDLRPAGGGAMRAYVSKSVELSPRWGF